MQMRLEQELKAKDEEKINLEQRYTSQQDELEKKKKETEKIERKLIMRQNEIADLQDEIHREREDLMDRIRELTREIRLKHLLIDQFIPSFEYMRIERRADWSDDINDWIIPNVEFTGNNIKIQKAKRKEGKDGGKHQGGQYLYEHVMNLEESEDEDYEAAATMRVNEAIHSILNEEIEDEAQLQYVPPEK
jgi:kinesin family protein 3/17